jgi:thymidylate synthase
MKTVHVVDRHLPLAWEKAVLACWNEGQRLRTEYDHPGDPDSRDVTCLIRVTVPHGEPRIHRAFPGGLDDLEKYRCEVLYGVHDHWIDPAAGKWTYTYHQRLREHGADRIDQLAAAVAKLRQAPHTRRAQAITWDVARDAGSDEPPCLQRLWFRVVPEEGGDGPGRLHMNVHIRSNDAFKAAFMNMYAFTELQAAVADEVGVPPGEYVHMADSFHIYGSYFDEFEGFLTSIESRAQAERVYTTDFARPFFLEGCQALLAEPDMPEDKRRLVHTRIEQLSERAGVSPVS